VSASREVELQGRRLRLTNLERVLWPRAGFTKRELIEYYLSVAPVLLPHLRRRPLTLGRWPRGIEGRGFAMTECRGRPEWLRTRPLRLRDGRVRHYCAVEDEPSLAWVANLGTIELHAYHFDAERPDEPTLVALDLDPGPGAGLLDACRVALLLRERLEDLGLEGCPKTSGGAGVHVYIPLGAPHPAERTRELARGLAATLAADRSDLVTDDPRAPARRGRVLVDWLQSEPRRSTVAPYSLRATDLPVVSTPVEWSELEAAVQSGDPGSLRFGPSEVLRRVERRGDLFGAVLALRQTLAGPADGRAVGRTGGRGVSGEGGSVPHARRAAPPRVAPAADGNDLRG
jgi:bifunctional non-homologous end joining protein LigD